MFATTQVQTVPVENLAASPLLAAGGGEQSTEQQRGRGGGQEAFVVGRGRFRPRRGRDSGAGLHRIVAPALSLRALHRTAPICASDLTGVLHITRGKMPPYHKEISRLLLTCTGYSVGQVQIQCRSRCPAGTVYSDQMSSFSRSCPHFNLLS